MTKEYCIWKFGGETPLTSTKHYIFPPRGHQWPFYNLKIHKISFPMGSKLALGYLIPDSTKISSNLLILERNFPKK